MNNTGNKMPSNKKFGLFFGTIFLIIFSYFFIKSNSQMYILSGSLSIIIYLIAFIYSNILKPINILWFKISLILHKITNPIILGAIFFILITPLSIFLRLIGRDELKLKKIKCSSYWKISSMKGTEPESFKNQF